MHQTSRESKRASHLSAAAAPAASDYLIPGAPVLIAGRWPVLALAGLTFLLTLLLFAPWTFWPAGYVAFVPWLVAVCSARRRLWVYLASYALGAVFFLSHWRWLYSTTPEGYFTGSLFFALYFVLAAWMVRHLSLRRGVSPAIAFPVAWILVEMIRSRGPLAFPWFLLGHSQIGLPSMAQLADLTGVYGISFVLGIVNGWLAELIIRWKDRSGAAQSAAAARKTAARTSKPPHRQTRLLRPVPTAFMLAVVAGTFIYGQVRLHTLPVEDGPRVAVLQGDYLLSTIDSPDAPKEDDRQSTYLRLLVESAEKQPDLFVLPETPWSMYLNRELRTLADEQFSHLSPNEYGWMKYYIRQARRWHDTFTGFAQRANAYLVAGAMSLHKQPQGSYPDKHRYNSAYVYRPQGGEPERYDKIHLVMFGEYVPFRYNRYLHWFYRWMNSITPWGAHGEEYSLTAGSDWRVFTMSPPSNPGRPRNFGITICYEDAIPQTFRKFMIDAAGRKRVDFMLNISNDGWFGHGSQQAQHLVNCAFRAIENRVGIARAVNTGISGFIAPDGRCYDLVGNGCKMAAGGTGARTAVVQCSPATTFYSRHGDIFGLIIALLALAAIVDATIISLQTRRIRHARKDAI